MSLSSKQRSSNPDQKSRRPVTAGFLLSVFLTVVCSVSHAEPPDPLDEGNRAFRAGDYQRALNHYQSARDAGFDDPLVYFNMAVAATRLDQLDQAEAWFVSASEEPRLAPRCYYSLGLIYRARGDDGQARIWFLQALADHQASTRLRQLARQALTGPDAPVARRRVAPAPVVLSRAEQRLAHPFVLSLNTQVAYDSNIYRSPGSSYVDLSDPAQPTVVPESQSGWFAPVDLATGLRWGQSESSEFALDYTFNGRFYTDSEFSNANAHSQRLALSGTLDKRRDPAVRRGTYLYSALVATRRDAEGYDRDTGTDQSLNGEDVSDRMSYTRYGPELEFHQDLGPIRVGLEGHGFLSRYEHTVTEIDYTHEQYRLGTFLLYRPWRRTHLQVSYDATQRNYEHWPSRDLNGDRFSNAPSVEYFYQEAGATVRQRLHSAFWFSLGYAYTDREDQHLGYDDYQRHTGRVAVHVEKSRFRARLAYVYRDYEFPNAFAFDTPTGGEKTLTKTLATLRAEYRLGYHLTLNGAAIYELTDSTDLRAEYDRTQGSLGLRWEW